MNRTTIFAQTTFAGIHYYPNAPEEVAFLASPHRHLFHVRLDIEVFGDNRELEFLMVKRRLDAVIEYYRATHVENLGSCEMQARAFIAHLQELYPDRWMQCEVSEDSENGATVEVDA